ncbi:TIGR02147 family protein [Chitinispirillales bacterium ANBcel5]|uniref:TIGR02147 family protein n=1 Tax=Cellulosispirillum alkaliphilum TaxID=3039283 RepID=UPI002A585585|nr:TIGR02147 family protein [Chitinispirillales bacterium ANBcel5]
MTPEEKKRLASEKRNTKRPVDIPCVFEYTDFRKYLRDWLSSKKKHNPIYSFRYMAQKTGFKSTGHLCLILNGEVKLSLSYMEGFISFLGLNRREREYFQTLVLYCQAKGHEDKGKFLEKLVSFKEFRCRVIDSQSYEFCERWYYSTIREIIAIQPFKGDYRDLARKVVPSVTPEEAKRAVQVLEKLKMIKRDERGVYARTDPLISTGTEMPTEALSKYVESTFDLARDALHNVPREERTISWATVSISEKNYELIRDELRAFRRKILELAKNDNDPDRVYHFQFNAFPMSKRIDDVSV